MRRTSRAVAVSVLLAACIAFVSQYSPRLSAAVSSTSTLAKASGWIANSIQPSARLPLLRTLRQRAAMAPGGAAGSATITTDKTDYPPSTNVTVTGTGWQAYEPVSLRFDESPNLDGPHLFTTTADGSGNVFDQQFWTDSSDLGITFTLTATGQRSGLTAQTTFTDAIPHDFKQCANEDTTLGNCHWINSIIAKQNSRIFEGMSTLQRVIFTDIPASVNNNLYRIQFHADAIKGASNTSGSPTGNAHAYDFITTWDAAIAATNLIAPPGVTQPVPLYPSQDPSPGDLRQRTATANAAACGQEIPDTGTTPSMHTVCLNLRAIGNGNVYVVPLFSGSPIGAIDGDSVMDRFNAYIARYNPGGTADALRIYSNQPLDTLRFTFDGYDNQDNSHWSLTFHGAGPQQPTQILVEFGAHVAVGTDPLANGSNGDVGYGSGKGAASISGAPFHVSLENFDNQLPGNQDNGMSSSEDNQLSNDVLVPPSTPSIVTQVRNPANTDITGQTVPLGTTVHDWAQVNSNSTIQLIPAGSTITFHRFNNGTCSGTPTDQTGVAVNPNGGAQFVTGNSSDFTPSLAGSYSYMADFVSSDTTKVLSLAGTVCEPFTVSILGSSVLTDIHNASHQVVTAVAVGTTVHDLVTVLGQPGQPTPQGNVTVDWFLNGVCSGSPASTSSPTALNPSGQADVTGFAFTPTTAGFVAFKGHYAGQTGVYSPSDGACEPLRVVDANIQINPASATNRIGTNHVLTAHVNVNDGTGFVNAPDGTLITFTKQSGPGTFVGLNTCTTSGGSGSCSVTITSSTAGTTVVQASTTVSVAGVSLIRTTGDANVGDSGNASKNWVNAAITITPSATNQVGQPHTFTVTVLADTGSGLQPAAGATVTVTLTPSNGANPVPPGPFTGTTNAAGQFQVTFTSATAGQVTGHATATLNVGTPPIPVTVSTDGVAPNSGDAVKTFVDANISISPLTGDNPVNANHILTGHVNINAGQGAGFVNAPDGTLISFSLSNSNGATATFVGPSSCTTAGGTGSCSVTITSPTAGDTAITATTNVTVGGVVLTRTTGDGAHNDGPSATKHWHPLGASVATDIHNAAHQVVTAVQVGTTVHDFVTVTGQPGNPIPQGNVTVDWFLNNSCTGAPQSTSAPTPLDATGHVDVTAFNFTVNTASLRAFKGHYLGQTGVYLAADGACEPLRVVDANIQLTPASANNAVGTNHTLTCHINVNDGSGFVNASAGTGCNGSILGGPGNFVGANVCSTVGTTGSCTLVITSLIPGTTTVQASTNVLVSGVLLTRTTGDANVGDSPNAIKNWADDIITTAVKNAGGVDITNHTNPGEPLGTIVHDEATVQKAPGTPAAVPAPTGTVTFILSNNLTCNGTVLGTATVGLVGSLATSPAVPNLGPGNYSYLATYSGDANYPAHTAACEPFAIFATHVQVIKTVNGAPPSTNDSLFTFKVCQGLTTSTPGTCFETLTTTTLSNVLNFQTNLVPGATYQLCELVLPDYTPVFGAPGFGAFDPQGQLPGYLCINFVANLTPQTLTITVDNLHQAGPQLTIGYWKNWASCSSSNGKQTPTLDQVLQLFEPGGFTVGILTLHDTNPDPNVASDCLQVVNLLNKTTIDGLTKMASDPLFNLAAQYVAYLLNVQHGSPTCAAGPAAQALLAAHNFNGLTHTNLNKAQAAYANQLNTLLDTYNNNNGCGTLPTPPNPL